MSFIAVQQSLLHLRLLPSWICKSQPTHSPIPPTHSRTHLCHCCQSRPPSRTGFLLSAGWMIMNSFGMNHLLPLYHQAIKSRSADMSWEGGCNCPNIKDSAMFTLDKAPLSLYVGIKIVLGFKLRDGGKKRTDRYRKQKHLFSENSILHIVLTGIN